MLSLALALVGLNAGAQTRGVSYDASTGNLINPAGLTLKEEYLPTDLSTTSQDDAKITLLEDEYFVLGDNRNASKDSRSFGSLNKSFITGKILFRGWPLKEITVFDKDYWPQYK